MMIKLMIVEDNDVVRQGLAGVLAREKDIVIARQAESGESALNQLMEGLWVDVMLVDWNIPNMNALELTRTVVSAYPAIKVIVLTMHGKDEYRMQAMEAGAAAYVLKDMEIEELADLIRKVGQAGGATSHCVRPS
jgi:DNA-binding NarL/FixJ family response regulator